MCLFKVRICARVDRESEFSKVVYNAVQKMIACEVLCAATIIPQHMTL